MAKCVCASVKTVNVRVLSSVLCYTIPRNVYTCLTVSNQVRLMRGLATNAEEDADEVDKIRDVSRLKPHHVNRMTHRAQPPDLTDGLPFMETKDFKRQIYGKYGKASGIDPGIMWPSKEELAELREDEEEWGEPSLQEMLEELQARKQQEAEECRSKEELVEKQLARMPQLIEQFKGKRLKVLKEEEEQANRKKALLEEARDHFGYEVDTRSEKFQALVAQKLAEKKEQRKKAKKEERAALIQKGEL